MIKKNNKSHPPSIPPVKGGKTLKELSLPMEKIYIIPSPLAGEGEGEGEYN
ncbi:MAG: hypothetical protein HY805_00305 [Nitrospirae bacterium]|nr:hypothetical protein [Nitrospirota bacterium]